MTFYELTWYFLIYSVVGWMTEVVFHASFKGNIVNRGFLNGPVCPVYGFGMIAVISLFNAVGSESFGILFLEGLFLATAVELVAGFLLDKLFHARWWDYSDMPLNLNGYICPAFSVIWGLAVVLVLKTFHKWTEHMVTDLIPPRIGTICLIVFYIFLITDTVVTAMTLIGLNKKLEELDRIASSLKEVSDKMTDRIGNKALKTTQTAQETMIKANLGRAELEKHAEEIRASIIKSRHYGAGRMLNVFPGVRHRDYKEIIKDLQSRLHSM